MNELFPGLPDFGGFGAAGKAPKNFLVPYLLLLLKQWNAYGYQLMQQLVAFGFAALDRGTVYRTLRQLERDGLVSSTWDTGQEGPARRVYSITDAGIAFLQAWASTLDQYRQTLDMFFDLYLGGSDRPAAGQEAPPPESRGVTD
ncbi:MAG TPA: poly-beta-hydroxybutyrate-responsive repressor [Dehalococcoidia bacterium]|nr:poly-beta-hydroxybutyrate-responsive repressor [Dehalococcoidia bacterium]